MHYSMTVFLCHRHQHYGIYWQVVVFLEAHQNLEQAKNVQSMGVEIAATFQAKSFQLLFCLCLNFTIKDAA